VLACIIIGVLPAASVGPYLDMAAHSALGAATPEYSLAVWHGFNRPLMMSLTAMAAGFVLYLALQRHLLRGIDGPPVIRGLEGRRMFERTHGCPARCLLGLAHGIDCPHIPDVCDDLELRQEQRRAPPPYRAVGNFEACSARPLQGADQEL
jgi:hypothetical protein